MAQKRFEEIRKEDFQALLRAVPPKEREAFIKQHRATNPPVAADLMWLEGEDLQHYFADSLIVNEYAKENRHTILNTIVTAMGGKILDKIDSTHNFIGKDGILRKGATMAYAGQKVLIPLNMRDGLLICIGKGNPEWNYSAPHGAGRLYSRNKAKELIALADYEEAMRDVYTTCVSESTIDESPFAYKDAEEIMRCIEPTADICEHLKPVYNFKAG